MTVVTGDSLRARKRLETRNRIVSAAVQVLSNKGIEEATVDEIAAKADVGKGTIYNYFRTKEEIVVAFLITIEEKIERSIRRFSSSSQPLGEVLVSFLQFNLKLKRPYYQFVRVFFSQLFASGNASSAWVRQLQAAIDPPLENLFAALRDRGLIRQDISSSDAVQLFKMLHVGLMAVWIVEGPPWKGTHRLLRKQVKVFCEGIEARSN
jgi:AcrR family transcriptional regulator